MSKTRTIYIMHRTGLSLLTMSTKTNIFFTGATGYIGGSVLSRLLKHPNAASFNITALVRSPEKAEKLKTLGVHPVVGSYSDLALVEKLTAKADVVIATADADNLDAAKAVLKGLKTRYHESGIPPILIQTSGTGVLIDDAAGDNTSDTIYDDANPDQIESIADTQPHRNVDVELLKADKDGYVKVYIILPSTIYGIASGVLVDAGIQNPHSQQVPLLIKASLGRGRAGMVGAGKNVWPNVDIEEVADLYIVLYDSIITNPATGHGREGSYFAENGEHNLYDVGKAIGEALFEIGKTDNPEPTTFTQEDLDKYFQGSSFMGTNCRAVANRSRSIGWKPVKSTKDLLASVKPEVVALAQKSEQA